MIRRWRNNSDGRWPQRDRGGHVAAERFQCTGVRISTGLLCIHIQVKVKVKCTLVQALRLCTGRTAHRGSRGIALVFIDHGTRRGWGVSVTPRPVFTPGKTRYPLYRRLGGPQGRSGQVRKISPSTGIRPADRPARSQSLYWLSYPAHTHTGHSTICLLNCDIRQVLRKVTTAKSDKCVYSHFLNPGLNSFHLQDYWPNISVFQAWTRKIHTLSVFHFAENIWTSERKRIMENSTKRWIRNHN